MSEEEIIKEMYADYLKGATTAGKIESYIRRAAQAAREEGRREERARIIEEYGNFAVNEGFVDQITLKEELTPSQLPVQEGAE